jgi:hypothetical protein
MLLLLLLGKQHLAFGFVRQPSVEKERDTF